MVGCCQNMFCADCLTSWMQNKLSCPLCRKSIEFKDLIFIKIDEKSSSSEEKIHVSDYSKIEIVFEDDIEEEDLTIPVEEKFIQTDKTKSNVIIDIIKNCWNKNKENDEKLGKFLIFSMKDVSFNLTKPLLHENNIYYKEIKGTKNTRENTLTEYQSTNRLNVIMLNAIYNGAGLNLEMTTDIILYDEMPPYIESQIIARANRINRGNIRL